MCATRQSRSHHVIYKLATSTLDVEESLLPEVRDRQEDNRLLFGPAQRLGLEPLAPLGP